MMQGYFKNHASNRVVFDLFYRQNPDDGAYAVCAGLAQVIDYIKSLHFDYEDIDYLRGLGVFDEDFLDYLASFHFTGDIYAIPEGTVVFPREPLLKVVAQKDAAVVAGQNMSISLGAKGVYVVKVMKEGKVVRTVKVLNR